MNRSFYIIIAVLVVLGSGCKKMPTAVENSASVSVQIFDQSGSMKVLFGDSLVRSADVTIRSINYGKEYHEVSDSSGRVFFNGLVSDQYSVVATRTLSETEMKAINGTSVQRKLFGASSSIFVRADLHDRSAAIAVDLAALSDIVFSEIYACGPQGSGLYFHDKYMEVCNISGSIKYLDGLVVARVSKGYILDPMIYTSEVWKFPGSGTDYAIQPGQFVLVAEDAIDHRINAPGSIDESIADFEYYRISQPDVDNPNVPNMIEIYQTSGVDWLIGGEKDALVLCRVPNIDSLRYKDNFLTIPKEYVIDGVEYHTDPTRLDQKYLDPKIDAGLAGGIIFYTGYSMERKLRTTVSGWTLEDNNNSSIDFTKIQHPTPRKHYALP